MAQKEKALVLSFHCPWIDESSISENAIFPIKKKVYFYKILQWKNFATSSMCLQCQNKSVSLSYSSFSVTDK